MDAACADGQYWDDVLYDVPAGATSAEVRLYYQSTSQEFVEFLRDENSSNTKGQKMFDLWNDNGKCPPEQMALVTLPLAPVCLSAIDGDGLVNTVDLLILLGAWGPC